MNQPTPSKNPATVKINELMIQTYLNYFMDKFLPTYTFKKTSGHRTEKENIEAGGVADSAHLYGLALDGNLVNNITGLSVTEEIGKKVFNQYFKPYWKGVALFEPSTPVKKWHIHLHIDRVINNYTKWGGIGAVVIAGSLLANKIFKKRKEGKENV